MAYTYIWPITLPQSPQDNFTESGGGINVIRTAPDQGPAKQRRRGLTTRNMQVSFLMSNDQVGYLETFINNTIRGTARFGFKHPRTQETIEVRIVPQQDGVMFTSSYLAPGYWTIQLQLEILP